MVAGTVADSNTRRSYDPAVPWSESIELRGAGGEPVDFARAMLSHGVADLPPNVIAEDGSSLESVLPAGAGAWTVRLVSAGPGTGSALLTAGDGAAAPRSASARAELRATVRHMLRLDEDLSAFYALARADPSLTWAADGAGRMLRSPTVFEDLVKTICTTNCTWSATVRMVSAIVRELGTPAERAPSQRAFPAPEVVAEADESFFRDVAKAGYRGAYLRAVAVDVAEGRLDLESLNDPALPDDEVAERLLALAGVGPYAMAHMMMLLGRYRWLILDSWTRPKYRRVTGRARITDKGIVRAFRRYGRFAGLAFWLTLTEDWVELEQT
jgi:N-glycosylase/DNA lyase